MREEIGNILEQEIGADLGSGLRFLRSCSTVSDD